MRKVGLEEWRIKVVEAMYRHVRSKVRVGYTYSDISDIRVGVYQGSVLSPLLFIIVLEAISSEFCTDFSWEMLYADNLVIVADSIEESTNRTSQLKTNLECKRLESEHRQGKGAIQWHEYVLVDTGKWSCGVCRKSIGRNSIFCQG